MKVLLWQTAYLGDVVLATSLLRILTKRFQKVGFVGRPFIKELLKGYNVELIPFNKGFLESFRIRKTIQIIRCSSFCPQVYANSPHSLLLWHTLKGRF
jgi:heptosyltransferase-2